MGQINSAGIRKKVDGLTKLSTDLDIKYELSK
jgi:hypothetical protein